MKANNATMNSQPKAMLRAIELDDSWRIISQFLDFPSLANLKRVSKRFYILVDTILYQEKDPAVLKWRIEELDAIAFKKLNPIIFNVKEYKKRLSKLLSPNTNYSLTPMAYANLNRQFAKNLNVPSTRWYVLSNTVTILGSLIFLGTAIELFTNVGVRLAFLQFSKPIC